MSKSQRKTILFFYSHLSSFVKKDIEMLSTHYAVKQFDFYRPTRAGTVLSFIRQKLFLLKNIWSADIVICQFASFHSFLPALFAWLWSKPSIIIVGGTDAVSFPSINYGNFNKPLLGLFTDWTYRLCSHIAPKHKTLMWCDYNYEPDDYSHQGVLYHCKNLKKPYTVITNGYDSTKWLCTSEKRQNTFITVCTGWQYPFQYKMKGIDLVVEVAPFFPNCEFIILGPPDKSIIPAQSPNVKVLPPAKNEDLADIYSECEFYLQLSMAEGFPNALCEAMLCECIPITSSVFSMPEIVADSGFVLKHKSVDELKLLIKNALTADKNALRKTARQRIAENYTYHMRKEKLLQLCKELAG